MAPPKSFFCILSVLVVCMVALSAGRCRRAADVENLRKLASANNHLALTIHKRLSSGSSKNIFFSPFSLSSAFGMLYYGTRGETAKELRKALGYDRAQITEAQVHQFFHQFLTESLSTEDNAYVLDTANAILLDKQLQLVPDYKKNIQDLYQAKVRDVDFVSENSKIVEEVNDWVKAKTHGKINEILEDLSPSTVMLLLNAVYFKGTWKTQFEKKKTVPQLFYNRGLESEAKEVPMMRMKADFPYAAIDDFKVLELPYKGKNISMMVLLPNQKDGLLTLESSLTHEKLDEIRQQLDDAHVQVALPKFKVEYFREMTGDFAALGAKRIFHPAADFSGMTPSSNVFVSEVLHKAVVEVNEEGSEAAGVTAIISNRMGMIDEPTFIADHPFLFAIVDNRNDMILFLGRINNIED